MFVFHKPKITELDARYAGGRVFKYCLEFNHPHRDGEDFCIVRDWCWEVFGPGRELKFTFYGKQYKWCFMTDNTRTRIYLLGDEELSWYKLRWE